jgi:hypothetical protein
MINIVCNIYVREIQALVRKNTVNMGPSPTLLRTFTRPSSASANALTIKSPRPAPQIVDGEDCEFVVRAAGQPRSTY